MGFDDRRFKVEEVDTGGFVMSAREAQKNVQNNIFVEDVDAIAETKEKVLVAMGKWLDGEDQPFEKKDGK